MGKADQWESGTHQRFRMFYHYILGVGTSWGTCWGTSWEQPSGHAGGQVCGQASDQAMVHAMVQATQVKRLVKVM